MQTYDICSPAILRNNRFKIYEDPQWGFLKVEDSSFNDCHGFTVMGTRIQVKKMIVHESMAICLTNHGQLVINGGNYQVINGNYSIAECDQDLIEELGFIPKTVKFNCIKQSIGLPSNELARERAIK